MTPRVLAAVATAPAAPDPTLSGAVWPSPAQELLLQAALAPREQALAAWRGWVAGGGLEHPDRIVRRLLPMVYGHLVAEGVDRAGLADVQPYYMETWKRGERLLRVLGSVIRLLDAAGIETLLIKGAALAPLYYQDAGVRWLGDLDVLVPEPAFLRATRVMERAGWVAYPTPVRAEYLDTRFTHAVLFHDASGSGLDLHCHILDMSWEPGADETFWTASVPASVRGVTTRTLCPTDHLLNVIVHGLIWVDPPPIGWVVDAMTVLRRAPAIDWRRLVAVARDRRANLFVAAALRYLAVRFDAPVPAAVLAELDALPVSRHARREYDVLIAPARVNPVWLARMHWLRVVRGAGPGHPLRALTLTPAYLRHWAQAHGIRIPVTLAARWARIARRRLTPPGPAEP